MSKGSKQRPTNYSKYSENWDKIFRRKMKVIIYGKDSCPYCDMAKKLCEQKELEFQYKKLGRDYDALEMALEFPTARTFPQIIVDGDKIGGYNEFKSVLVRAQV
jgi:glutaredoxin